MSDKERFSYKLTWVNFILAFCIVIIHIINSNTNIEVFFKMISHISGIGVSCFFAISGFLFYYKFDYNKIIDKLKRRFFTLIVPFVAWNTSIYIT